MTASTLELRRAEVERDLDGILEVDRASFTNPWTREMYEWEARHSDVARLWVARDPCAPQGPVVGYCSGWVIFDELHVNNLAVHPDWRGRGIARALLAFVLADAAREGAVRATLEVRRSNAAARRLYEGAGFAVTGTRAQYYRAPIEDALILWRGDWRPGGGGSGVA